MTLTPPAGRGRRALEPVTPDLPARTHEEWADLRSGARPRAGTPPSPGSATAPSPWGVTVRVLLAICQRML